MGDDFREERRGDETRRDERRLTQRVQAVKAGIAISPDPSGPTSPDPNEADIIRPVKEARQVLVLIALPSTGLSTACYFVLLYF